MITDPLFYRLFATSPETFFLLLGMPVDSAREMAARYQYQALEVKETAHRLDGIFLPKESDLPLYFLEVQFYRLPGVFADLLAKVYTYLKQHDPSQAFCGVVLFAERALEPLGLAPYQPLIEASMVRRFYLDEMPELADAPPGLSILYLIRQAEGLAPETARNLIVRVKSEIADESLRDDLVELIETVILYKLPRLSREEIQNMLQVQDIRESRVYQEALEEGREEATNRDIAKLAAKRMSASEIAELLDLDLERVRRVIDSLANN
ncbi:MAG TPA: Rpn family recombination-promoting nuclease/putative transposase [Gemmataceae bacterium]|jgi:predicted transposase/invertase (TIGR01784 family)|nr:Rpn family recombination-promoting nuclease/putative transposase [Gemmataceae bacterium]